VRQQHTFVEYVRLEEMSPVKHEFLEGLVWAMAGGSPNHAGIAANISGALSLQLRDQPCQVFSSDLRIRVRETGLATYPDVSVVCGRLEMDPEDPKQQTVVNPRVLVEVLSPSTEAYDRGEKLAHYKRIMSVDDIVLVAHDRCQVEVWHRAPSGWVLDVTHDHGSAEIPSIAASLSLDEVYRNPLAESQDLPMPPPSGPK
jgi:Uma2 family endonuclease